MEKYLKLCPPYYKKANFYLHSLSKPTPTQWYGEQVIGQATLSKTVKNLLKEADIEGYFTNHSCRRSGTTRLFQAGLDKKLIKEVTGHRSDAVDKYAVTSDDQREQISNIMYEKPKQNVTATVSIPPQETGLNDSKSEVIVKTCSCGGQSGNLNSKNVGLIVDDIMSRVNQKGKTVIKIQIEITKE